jgi:hypothetical protein
MPVGLLPLRSNNAVPRTAHTHQHLISELGNKARNQEKTPRSLSVVRVLLKPISAFQELGAALCGVPSTPFRAPRNQCGGFLGYVLTIVLAFPIAAKSFSCFFVCYANNIWNRKQAESRHGSADGGLGRPTESMTVRDAQRWRKHEVGGRWRTSAAFVVRWSVVIGTHHGF